MPPLLGSRSRSERTPSDHRHDGHEDERAAPSDRPRQQAEHERAHQPAEVVGDLPTGEHRRPRLHRRVVREQALLDGVVHDQPEPEAGAGHAEQRDGGGDAGGEAEEGRHEGTEGEVHRAAPAAVGVERHRQAQHDAGDDRHRRQTGDPGEVEVEGLLHLGEDDVEAATVEGIEERVTEQHRDRA